MSSLETVFQEPREALEDPKTSSLFHSPCERDPHDGPPLHGRFVGMQGRCTDVSRAAGAGDRADPNHIPRPLSLVEGDMVQMSGDNLFEGRLCLTEGNRIYDTI